MCVEIFDSMCLCLLMFRSHERQGKDKDKDSGLADATQRRTWSRKSEEERILRLSEKARRLQPRRRRKTD